MKTIGGGTLCFVLWMLGAIYFYQNYFTDPSQGAAVSSQQAGLASPGNSAVTLGKMTPAKVALSKGLAVFENGERLLSCKERISCSASSDTLQYSVAVSGLLDTLAFLIEAKPGKALLVVSRYDAVESQPLLFENFALARAEFLKSELVARKVEPARIKLLSQKEEGLFTSKTALDLFDLILMDEQDVLQYFSKVESESAKGGAPKGGTRLAVTRRVSFDYGTSRIKTEEASGQYFDDLSKYLNKNHHRSVEITGHTCNVSSSSFNEKLGLERAQAVRNLLISKGLQADRIKAQSAGESRPIAENATREGKSANRRVEIVIH